MDFNFSKRTAFLIVWDICATILAYFLSCLLTGLLDIVFFNYEIYFVLGFAAVVNFAVFLLFKLYNNLWEYASVDDVIRIVIAVGVATLIQGVFLWALGAWVPVRVCFGAFILMIFFAGGARMFYRIMRRKRREFELVQHAENRPRTLVVGAGETGSLAIDRMASKDPLMPGDPIIAVDDDPNKLKQRIHGVRVAGTSDDILDLVDRFDIEQIVVAVPSATLDERKRIYSICTETDCQLRTLPNVRDLKMDEIEDITLREVDVADLLGRDEVVLNTRMVSGYLAGQIVLVTGGGGSIGSELCRQLCTVAPSKIIIYDIYENDAYLLRNEILRNYDDIDCIVEIGNVCDAARLRDVFAQYRPSVVFHAAAHKHVPLMEMCPREAIQNNVFGTLNTVKLAMEFDVKRFIFISTDKAVNPTSVMGATKRMGEMIIQHFSHESDTTFAAVRFGNVLGSNGSVIPVFKRQIAAGGPITVTHKDIERYFMTIPEASRLVIQAGGMAKGGEVFILDMGEPVKIVDLAKSLIQLSGLRVDHDIKIVYTGLRPGEKMYEELLMNEENTLSTDVKGIMISTGEEISFEAVEAKIERLREAMNMTDEQALEVLEEVVPTYNPHNGEEEAKRGSDAE